MPSNHSDPIRPVLLAMIIALAGCAHRPIKDDKTAALSLPYQQFDQTPDSGWRVLAADKQLHAAARLIEAYLARHAELDRFQRSNLHWHAAQALALAGDTTAALKHLPPARLDPEPPGGPVHWNDYVTATEAFLRHDRAGLTTARARMAADSRNGEDPNLPIIDSLIRRFDEPYAQAYKID